MNACIMFMQYTKRNGEQSYINVDTKKLVPSAAVRKEDGEDARRLALGKLLVHLIYSYSYSTV